MEREKISLEFEKLKKRVLSFLLNDCVLIHRWSNKKISRSEFAHMLARNLMKYNGFSEQELRKANIFKQCNK